METLHISQAKASRNLICMKNPGLVKYYKYAKHKFYYRNKVQKKIWFGGKNNENYSCRCCGCRDFCGY